ncbi:MAG: prephenate dehydrogenase [Campylobacterales bacterium]|nr:prephenate dehydrogenase [Campylobacterales bacterium]
MGIEKIGIVGLGLMGGSLALALRKKYQNIKIYGYDHNSEHAEEARELGLVKEVVDDYSKLDMCDVIFLATPIDGSIEILQNLSNIKKETTIVDLGSTKALISNTTPSTIRENLVAAHPMTGTEKSGPSASFETLYAGKTVVLCDINKSGEKQQKLAQKIFTDIGMKIVYMDSKEHDRHAAYISHMPHAISYALANSVMKQEDPRSIIALAGGGFRDMSRIAKSSPKMWSGIFKRNKEHILESIESFKNELEKCEKFIENEEWDLLQAWMKEANKLHDIL